MTPMPYKALLVMVFAWLWFGATFALAQVPTAITPTVGSGSLGTTVTVDGNTVQITGGARPGNGPNLFHSFGEFSIPHNNIANFLNDSGLATSNILGRVTGGNASNIFGTIQTTGFGNANLFLMNPVGIVFGPNTTLNVGGSVAFTTADYLRLANADGSNAGIFHANPTTTSLLTSAGISAFGFLGSNPAAIAVQGGTLMVQPNQSISLVGGNMTVQSARLLAPGGQIHIASVASPGEVLAKQFSQTGNINGQTFGRLGTIQASQQSSIDTSGEGGGTIRIRGGSLIVDDSRISANSTKAAKLGTGSRLDPSWLGIGIEMVRDAVIENGAIVESNVESGATHGAGGVRITANAITISGEPQELTSFAGIRSNASAESTAANGGDILLDAATIEIKDAGQIETRTASTVKAGDITLRASEDIHLDTATISSLSETSSGHAGDIAINTSQGSLRVSNSFITSQTFESTGTAGSIKIGAPNGNIFLVDQTAVGNVARGKGRLQGIQIVAIGLWLDNNSLIVGDNLTQEVADATRITLHDRLTLAGGSEILTGSFGPADVADLSITSRDIFITENSSLITSTKSSGNAGRISLFAETLNLNDGGKLGSRSLGNSDGISPSGRGGTISIQGSTNAGTSVVINGAESGILTDAQGTGAAGDIVINVKSVTLQNGGTISAETTGISSTATGGSITVNTTDQVTLTNGASITSSSTGPADAGKILINAGQQLEVLDGSSITTQAAKASGGNIDIRAIDRIRFVNSSISTSVLGEDGSGGNIFIDPKVVILEGSNVTAESVGGTGGNITFVTPLFLQDSASQVSAKSQRGVSGTVNIQSPTANLSGVVGQLASKTSTPQVLLQNRCVALAGGEQSTFILAGRNTLPVEPGGWLSSPVSMEHWTGVSPEHASTLMVQSPSRRSKTWPAMITPKSEANVLSLRRLTPPGFLVRAFATPSTGCPS